MVPDEDHDRPPRSAVGTLGSRVLGTVVLAGAAVLATTGWWAASMSERSGETTTSAAAWTTAFGGHLVGLERDVQGEPATACRQLLDDVVYFEDVADPRGSGPAWRAVLSRLAPYASACRGGSATNAFDHTELKLLDDVNVILAAGGGSLGAVVVRHAPLP